MQNSAPLEQRVYAGFAIRAAAFLVDILIVKIFLLPINLIFGIIGLLLGDNILMSPILFQYNVFDIMGYLLIVVYFVLTTYFTGQTLGKKVFEICVVSKNDAPLKIMNVIYRETVGRFLSSLLFVGYFLIFVEADKRSLHDFLCETRVIYRFRKAKEQAEKVPNAKQDEVRQEDECAGQEGTAVVLKKTETLESVPSFGGDIGGSAGAAVAEVSAEVLEAVGAAVPEVGAEVSEAEGAAIPEVGAEVSEAAETAVLKEAAKVLEETETAVLEKAANVSEEAETAVSEEYAEVSESLGAALSETEGNPENKNKDENRHSFTLHDDL